VEYYRFRFLPLWVFRRMSSTMTVEFKLESETKSQRNDRAFHRNSRLALRRRSFSWPVLAKFRFSRIRTTSWRLHDQLSSFVTRRIRLTTPGKSSSIASGFSSIGIHWSVSLTRPRIVILGLVDFWITRMSENATLATSPT
jgi:hypothetical protein